MFKELSEGQTYYCQRCENMLNINLQHTCGVANNSDKISNKLEVHCLSSECPERKGGKCDVIERNHIIEKYLAGEWQEVFRMFYDDNESGGSSRWKVTPDTVKNFIIGLLEINKIK